MLCSPRTYTNMLKAYHFLQYSLDFQNHTKCIY